MKKLGIAAFLILSCIGITAWAQTGSSFMIGMTIADEASGGGTLIFARNEGKGAPPQFGYYYLVNGRVIEIEVKGPEVVKNKEIKDIPDKGPVNKKLIDALKTRVKSKLPNSRYIEIALEKTKGKDVISYALNVAGEEVLIDVKTDTGGVTLDLGGKTTNTR